MRARTRPGRNNAAGRRPLARRPADKDIKIELQGGEPLLRLDVLTEI
uniref:Uncharacterized protein n=1 Tax=Rhizobium leguminosarum bv. viciae TaxID=387 RepID=A0A0U3K5A6_RHILV|nr:hypothetical protein [Rhizobium leguminosarum bv. viciae]